MSNKKMLYISINNKKFGGKLIVTVKVDWYQKYFFIALEKLFFILNS